MRQVVHDFDRGASEPANECGRVALGRQRQRSQLQRSRPALGPFEQQTQVGIGQIAGPVPTQKQARFLQIEGQPLRIHFLQAALRAQPRHTELRQEPGADDQSLTGPEQGDQFRDQGEHVRIRDFLKIVEEQRVRASLCGHAFEQRHGVGQWLAG